jgi:uncharacterized alkaline shock family protein YloU
MAENEVQNKPSVDEIGTVRIADDVVSAIIAYAAKEVEGVAGLAGNAGDGFLKKAGMKRPSMGVRVEMENGNVKADLSLIMDYGYNIPATSSKVQTRVRQAVENMTGLHVEDVDVRIAGIHMPEEGSLES